MAIGLGADYLWSHDPAITAWLERVRLNPSRGLRRRISEPRVRRATKRSVDNVRPALERPRGFGSAPA